MRPRPEYGLIVPLLTHVDGAVRCAGGASRLLLSSTVDWILGDGEARATVHVTAGQTAGFALEHGRLANPPLRPYAPDQIDASLQSFPICPDGAAAGRSESATPPGRSRSSTSTANCWLLPTGCVTSSRSRLRRPGTS